MRRSRYFVQHLLYLHLTFCWMLRLRCIYNRGISRHFCHCVSSLKWRRSARAGKSPVPLFTAPTIWSRPPVRGSFKGHCGSWCRQIKKGGIFRRLYFSSDFIQESFGWFTKEDFFLHTSMTSLQKPDVLLWTDRPNRIYQLNAGVTVDTLLHAVLLFWKACFPDYTDILLKLHF